MANDTRDLQNLRLMVVDDKEGMRKLICGILAKLGYTNVIALENGAEAWYRLEHEQIDMVLTDRRMPMVGGEELVQQIRQAPEFAEIPVLMFSGYNEPHEVESAMRAGVDAYLPKPFTPLQLQEKLEGLLFKDLGQRIERIVTGAGRYSLDGDGPLVVLGEVASSVEELNGHPDAAQFLWQAIAAIEHINISDPEIALGYELESEVAVIGGHLRQLGSRVKVLVVSAEIEGICTLVRLTGINTEELTIVFVCEALEDLPDEERAALQDLGVFVIERNELPRDSFERLFREFAVSQAYTPSRGGVPPREEIRRRVEADINNLVSLPVLPKVYLEIGKLDMDPESEILDWASVIDQDPLASAMVVRRAHSPVYGFAEEVDNTRRAVTLLGKRTVKDLIVCQAVKQAFHQVTEKGFSIEDYWLHSLAVALTARALAYFTYAEHPSGEIKREFDALGLSEEAVQGIEGLRLDQRLELDEGDDPFAAGMIHDIGKVAMVVSYPGLFPELMVELESQSWRIPMVQAETRVAGRVNHMVVGGLLAERWGQSSSIVAATGHHHEATAAGLALLVALADFLAGAVFPFPSEAVYPVVEVVRDELVWDEEMLGDIGSFLPENALEQLDVGLEQLLELGRVLAPETRRLVGEWQQLV